MAGEYGYIEYEDGTRVELDEDDAPELTDEMAQWLVAVADFDGDNEAVTNFLISREDFLRKAEAAGVPREAFLPFDPNTPGFEERAKVLMNLPKALGWAAE